MNKIKVDNEIVIYESDDGKLNINVRMENETVWLTIDKMADLFNKGRSTINEHILNIYDEKELEKSSSMRKIGNSDFSTKPNKNSFTRRLEGKEVGNFIF